MGFSFYSLVFSFFLALTQMERWRAGSRFNNTTVTGRWFVPIAVVAIIVLAVFLLVVSLRRAAQRRKDGHRLFLDHAERRGLSARECEILVGIASKAGLKQSNAIFTMDRAFNHGAAEMIAETLAQKGVEESKHLRRELSFLREKLGFREQHSSSASSPAKSRKLSSRQILPGKKVHITRRKSRVSDDIEATVIENNDTELTIRSAVPVEVTLGEFWRVRYYFGASVWEFEASVVDCHGDILILSHSDNVRFINRRRFLRVSVDIPAFVARFPFARVLPPGSVGGNDGLQTEQGLASASSNSWGPPEFVPAVVTELAGPGLRIEVPLKVKVGDRVLVVFWLR